ncbi:hypothetical protein ABIE78_001265 [Sinorhizobium fredii]|uniref:Uncharacterized protein n=1 Tax=Sinorhizobium fredii (strain USDA 257) TaxID=1185652 RepID=I3XAD9_SINF2|nr:hypothetical protein USDA257_c43060 [Sinorhizobium fredii USDA 257]
MRSWRVETCRASEYGYGMKNVRYLCLFLATLPLILSSCSESATPAVSARASGKVQAATKTAAKPSPRQCSTPAQVCPYGTGPAGEPCSCWATDGTPDVGVTTMGTQLSPERD